MPLHLPGFDGGDRSTIELPLVQQQLVQALAALGKPLVIVLMNGGAIALQETAENSSAVLEAWYPGQNGGTAIAETLFGENNPSGRLPVTFYAGTDQLPPFDNYAMKGRTYRYFTGKPLYPFGYGLSYAHFEYASAKLSTARLHAGDPLIVDAQVKNIGDRDGDETIEVYLLPKNRKDAPLQTLIGFQKISLCKGGAKWVHIAIEPRQLSIVAPDGQRLLRPGEYEIYVGGSLPSQSSGGFLPFQIEGPERTIH